MIPVPSPARTNHTTRDADAATPPDQHVCVNIANAEVRTKVWLELNGDFLIGEAGLHLLRAITVRRSLAAAAHEVGWSYRHAWGYVRRAERALGGPITCPVPGKGTARGMVLNTSGEQLLRRLVALSEAARRAVVHA